MDQEFPGPASDEAWLAIASLASDIRRTLALVDHFQNIYISAVELFR